MSRECGTRFQVREVFKWQQSRSPAYLQHFYIAAGRVVRICIASSSPEAQIETDVVNKMNSEINVSPA